MSRARKWREPNSPAAAVGVSIRCFRRQILARGIRVNLASFPSTTPTHKCEAPAYQNKRTQWRQARTGKAHTSTRGAHRRGTGCGALVHWVAASGTRSRCSEPTARAATRTTARACAWKTARGQFSMSEGPGKQRRKLGPGRSFAHLYENLIANAQQGSQNIPKRAPEAPPEAPKPPEAAGMRGHLEWGLK